MDWEGRFAVSSVKNESRARAPAAGVRFANSGRVFHPSTDQLLNLRPQLCPRIFGVQRCEFSQELLGALITGHWDLDRYFNDLITACAILGGRRHAFFTKPQFLSLLGSRRNLQ